MGAWLAGVGCVPIFDLMEDAATAEISRAQIWHWIRSPLGVLEDGRKVDAELFTSMVPEEISKIRQMLGDTGFNSGKYDEAAKMFTDLTLAEEFVEFLTLPAYEQLRV